MKYYKYIILVVALFSFAACEKEDESTDGTGDSVNLSRDLACYFNFDSGQANDLSGNGFNGVITYGTEMSTDTPKGTGKSVSLDGTSQQFINIPYNIIGDSVNYSISLWLKDFGTGALVTSISGNTFKYPSFYINSNCRFRLNVSGSTITINQDISYLQTKVWHHVVLAATRKQKKVYLYVDGQLFDSQDISNISANGSKMVIGGDGSGTFDSWADPMLLDNFRVYRRCLSGKEVDALYRQELE